MAAENSKKPPLPNEAQLAYGKCLDVLKLAVKKNGMSLADAFAVAFDPNGKIKQPPGLSDIVSSDPKVLMDRYRIAFYEFLIEAWSRTLEKNWKLIKEAERLGKDVILERLDDHMQQQKNLASGRELGAKANKSKADTKLLLLHTMVDDYYKEDGKGWENGNKWVCRKIRTSFPKDGKGAYADSSLQKHIDTRIAQIKKAKKKSLA